MATVCAGLSIGERWMLRRQVGAAQQQPPPYIALVACWLASMRSLPRADAAAADDPLISLAIGEAAHVPAVSLPRLWVAGVPAT